MNYWRKIDDGYELFIKLTPRARKSQILGLEGDRLRISLNVPPVDGAANEALIKFLAKCLNINKSSLTLLRGEKSREKTILIYSDHLELDKLTPER